MATGTATAGLLRQEVGELRRRETRRVFDLMVYVGTLDGPRDCFVARRRDLPALDAALRIEVVSRLLEDLAGARAAWVTRPGMPETYESDIEWLTAASTAFAMHGQPLESFHAVTRYGWRDVRTGETRVWKRLRL